MAAASPTLFRKARILDMDPIPGPEGLTHFETEGSRMAITAEPNEAWTLVRPTIEEVRRVARRQSEYTPFSTPVRVEGFRNDRLRQQGMAIFDTYGRLVIHIWPAVINKGRDSMNLCLNIVKSLGIKPSILLEIFNDLQGESNYLFVISCEQHELGADGKEIVIPTLHTNSEWVKWIIR